MHLIKILYKEKIRKKSFKPAKLACILWLENGCVLSLKKKSAPNGLRKAVESDKVHAAA